MVAVTNLYYSSTGFLSFFGLGSLTGLTGFFSSAFTTGFFSLVDLFEAGWACFAGAAGFLIFFVATSVAC